MSSLFCEQFARLQRSYERQVQELFALHAITDSVRGSRADDERTAHASVTAGHPAAPTRLQRVSATVVARQQQLVELMKPMFASAGLIYVVTHDYWLPHNQFKVGKTGIWGKRLSNYNAQHPTDVWPVLTYVCRDMHLAENMIKLRLGAYLLPNRQEFVTIDIGQLRHLIESVLETDPMFSTPSLVGGGGEEDVVVSADAKSARHQVDRRGFHAYRVKTGLTLDAELDKAQESIRVGLCPSKSFHNLVRTLERQRSPLVMPAASAQAMIAHIKLLVSGGGDDDDDNGRGESKKALLEPRPQPPPPQLARAFVHQTIQMNSCGADGRPIVMDFLSIPDIDVSISLKSRCPSLGDAAATATAATAAAAATTATPATRTSPCECVVAVVDAGKGATSASAAQEDTVPVQVRDAARGHKRKFDELGNSIHDVGCLATPDEEQRIRNGAEARLSPACKRARLVGPLD